MYTLSVKTHFDAAHHLEGYPGKCANLHGHRWDVELKFVGARLDDLNMLIDFVRVKEIIKKVIDERLDHQELNNVLEEPLPTAEFLATWIFLASRSYIADNFTSKDFAGAVVKSVTVWESPECSATFEVGV